MVREEGQMHARLSRFAGLDPERIEVSRSGTTAERAEQALYLVSQLEKPALLLAL